MKTPNQLLSDALMITCSNTNARFETALNHVFNVLPQPYLGRRRTIPGHGTAPLHQHGTTPGEVRSSRQQQYLRRRLYEIANPLLRQPRAATYLNSRARPYEDQPVIKRTNS